MFIDADAMPKRALAIARKLAADFDVGFTTVSSIRHELSGEGHVTVDASPQATDMEIVRRIQSNVPTCVVTQDYGLAALVLARGAHALSPTGRVYTEDNIDALLAERAVSAQLRKSRKVRLRGPRARTIEDDTLFERHLRQLLEEMSIEDKQGVNNRMRILNMEQVSWVRGERAILNDINWTINQGEHWAIVGLNGSGKTTLLNLMNGYIWPTTGQIEVLGHPFGRTDMQEMRKHIGWVSAAMADRITTDRPYEQTLDVVISGKYASVGLWTKTDPSDTDEALAYMERLGCRHLVGRSLNQLSQGEKQRMLIARALMAKPQLLILDEPCTGLDVQARENILASVQAFTEDTNGPTVLYVTHHIEEIVPGITHGLVVQAGQIAASGKKEQVLNSLTLSAAFEVPVEVDWHDNRAWLRVSQ